MKNFKLTISTLLLLAAFISCKKKDTTPTNAVNAKISQIIESSTNTTPRVQEITYDAKHRNALWTYDGITISRSFTLSGREVKYQYILNNEGLAIEGNSQTIFQNYRRKFIYDNQKRITKITIDEQYLDANGSPNTNFKLTKTHEITWDANNNITSAKSTEANDGSYIIYTFEGYAANYPNTVKTANIGLDIFGSQGYPRNIDQGNSPLLTEPLFAGAQLPAKLTTQYFKANNTIIGEPYVTNYNYEKDKQGRISLISPPDQSFRFNYN